MKTTNYELSKKLAEIEFKAKSETLKHDPNNPLTGEKYLSYDLETLLEALSNKITSYSNLSKSRPTFQISINETGDALIDIRYTDWEKFAISKTMNYKDYEIREVASSLKGESLADVVGKLIIRMHEKGLINFGGKND